MRAAVTKDRTTRVITMEVRDVPDIDVTTYQRKPRIFRPDTVIVELVDGKMSSVRIMGGLVLKSGEASDLVREAATYYPDDTWASPRMSEAPKWLQPLVADAPTGVTTWRTDFSDGPA